MIEMSFKGGLVAVLVYGLILPLALRIFSRSAPLLVFCAGGLAIHVLATVVLAIYMPGCPYWHGAALFWFGFMAYLYGFNTLYKSMSIDMIARLAASPGGRLSQEEICNIVEGHFVARTRLLVDSRYVDVAAGVYLPTVSGQRLASRIRRAQCIFGITVSGLYSSW